MKTLYIDCGMGAAGDMLTAALLSLLPDPQGMIDKLNSLGIPDVEFRYEPAEKCGITGSQVRVLVHGVEEESHDHEHHHDHDHDHEHEHHHEHHHEHQHEHDHEHQHEHEHEHQHEHDEDHHHDHEHHHDHDHEHDHEHHHDHDHEHDHEHHHHHSHRTLGEIRQVVKDLPLENAVKEHITAVYASIAEAEGHVHGKPVEEIHFHEVGTWDAVADVTAVSLILHELDPEEIVVSPIHVGSGHVHCAHGILPVPAPATAFLLRDIPIYSTEIKGELCTPTGAALLRHFATRFGTMPVMRTTGIGYGMGKKDFPIANCVRVILGDTEEASDPSTVLSISCNVDDMTAEEIGFAMDRLFQGGAKEVFTTPVTMKKSRPGTLLTVICREADRSEILRLLFRHTTTIGVREQVMNRYTLDRRIETVDTPYGPVQKKISEGYGVCRTKWEYEDLARIATETGRSLEEIRNELSREHNA